MNKARRLGSFFSFSSFVRKLPWIFFGVYSILSILLYKERLFADSGFYFFSITNFESLMIPHGRWAVAILQLPLLAAVGMGAPLKLAALIFSLSFPMFYAVIYFLNGHILRSRRAAWIPVGLLAFSSPTLFFWPVSELMLGLAVLSVLVAVSDSELPRMHSTIIIELLCVLVCIIALMFHIGTYPIIIFLLAFLWLDSRIKLRTLGICLCSATVFVLFKLAIGLDDYESNRLALNASLLDWTYLPRLFRNFVSGQIFVTLGLCLIMQHG